MLHQTFLFLGQLWQLFEVSQILEFLRYLLYYYLFMNNYRLLNVYCEIFGMSSYGDGRTSLRVRLRHMNECRIFHYIHSITFLLYTFYIYLLVLYVQST